ncbi:MAG: hypothetical protein WKF34_00075 [Pyrinomonadaceae bacterium]
MYFLSTAIFLACLPTAILDFAIPQWKADDAMRIEDAYKWIHQATRGGEHAAPSETGARDWLVNELKMLGPTKSAEAVWEPLCKGGDVGRLNLRPFRDRRGEPEVLLRAFLASAREYRSDRMDFSRAWDELGKRLKAKPIGMLTHAEWRRVDARARTKDYAAIHHSKSYEAANLPAYRVLTKAEMLRIVPR